MSEVLFNLKKLRGKNIAINCISREEARAFITWVNNLGKDNEKQTFWSEYGEDSCYILTSSLLWKFDCKETTINEGFNIINYEDALLKQKPNKN